MVCFVRCIHTNHRPQRYLSAESLLDMTANPAIYDHVYRAVALLAQTPALVPLLAPLPHQDKSLAALLRARAHSAAAFLTRLGVKGAAASAASSAGGDAPLEQALAQRIIAASAAVKAAIASSASAAAAVRAEPAVAVAVAGLPESATLDEKYRVRAC